MGKFKNFILWNYSRETSVYVIFCLAIVAFIFLTPKTWFSGKGIIATRTQLVIVKPSQFPVNKDFLEQRVREITGNGTAELVGWHERKNDAGETIYEVEYK
jgi:hypothetical protein